MKKNKLNIFIENFSKSKINLGVASVLIFALCYLMFFL